MADQFTDEQLEAALVTSLESWPLYRQLLYKGGTSVHLLPRHLSLFCPRCRKDTFWETSQGPYDEDRGNFGDRVYRCRNCGRAETRYYFLWSWGEKDGQGSFVKVGQFPPLEERTPEALERLLDREDLSFYRSALRLRNFNLGVGAVSYLRRVVENRMNDVLDVLYEAAVEHSAPREALDRIASVKAERRFSDKIDYAATLMPEHLRPAGRPNPVAILHELASDGLHSKSDAECVEIFDRCRNVFEYVFTRLRLEAEEAKRFVDGLSGLARRDQDST